jgi:hypothetical protein
MESTERTWSDARMDDFAKRTEDNLKETRTELKGEIKDLRAEMNERFAGIEQRFNILFGALATGFVAAVVQHFLG